MKDKEIKKVCKDNFEKIIKKLQKNVDRNLVELTEKWRIGSSDYYVFSDAIELKFACGITVTKEDIERNCRTKKAIKNLFNAKLKQAIISYVDYLEDEVEKFNKYYNKIKDT